MGYYLLYNLELEPGKPKPLLNPTENMDDQKKYSKLLMEQRYYMEFFNSVAQLNKGNISNSLKKLGGIFFCENQL